jgi:predicted DNA helicase
MKLLIQGLEGQGPGDILGAVGGETSLDPTKIGDIDIRGEKAFLEFDGDVEQAAEEIDGIKIGNSEVEASTMEDKDLEKLEEVEDYVSEYQELVELEREEEMRQHEEEIKNMSGSEREAKGRAVLHLRARDEGEGIEGQKVKFMRNHKGEELPETEISVGDLVMISKNDPLRDDNPTGTVIEKTNYSITAAFDSAPGWMIKSKGLRMDLYVNDITYQRMKDALGELETDDLEGLRDRFIGLEEPGEPEREEVEEWENGELNESQREAVEKVLGSEDFHMIHGPPGTGKTTTAIEVIQQAVKQDKSVLSTADSNIAVDNMLDFLLDQGVNAVRVGHPARVTEKLREHTLDALIEENEKYQKSQEVREKAFELKDKQDDLQHPSGRWRRGMSNEKIKNAAEEGRGSRGVPEEKIQEMAEWLEIQEEANELFEKSDRLEDEAVEEILESMDVVLTTNSTAGSELMQDKEFDLVVIDEATQSTEPSCMIPITKTSKAVMAGDHRQLPPTVKSKEAARELENTLFERLAEKHPEKKTMLRTQYRMNTSIMEFSSQEFYDGKLKANESVADYTLEELGVEEDSVLEPELPFTFVDTKDIEAVESTPEGSTSKENPREAEEVEKFVEEALEQGVDPEDVAVISPYDAQVDLLNQKIDVENLEIKTVDGFQGREKELVVISLVRSNSRGEIGFLKDVRRLNVALTRARRKLVVLGDSETLEVNETYRNFVDYVEETENCERKIL